MSHKSLHENRTGTATAATDSGYPARDDKLRKEALQVTKEIVVKFIEIQRVSPTNFAEVFPAVYSVVCRAIADSAVADTAAVVALASDSASPDACRRD